MLIEPSQTIFTASTIAGVQFPLGVGSSPPLHFQSLDSLTKIRQGQGSPPPPLQDLVSTPGALSKTVQDLTTAKTSTTASTTEQAGRFGQIALAILLLGYGYTDEGHNLITPLSWPDDIYFAAGPSVYYEMTPDVQAFATYTHCLVHRREAFNVGEFGMVGFANANYWSNAVQRLEGASTLPHAEWHAQMVALGSKPEFLNCPLIQTWCRQHGFLPERTPPPFFDSKALHGLCATVLKATEATDSDHASLKLFAEQAVASEIRILLNKALERAGITVEGTGKFDHVSTGTGRGEGDGRKLVAVNEDVAVRVMNRISSAHRDNFLTNKCIVLRRLAVMEDSTADREMMEMIHMSVVSGIACRLFHSPACKIKSSPPCWNSDHHSHYQGLCILIALNAQAAMELETRIRRQYDLNVGDVVVVQLSQEQGMDETLQNINGLQNWYLEPCSRDDPHAIFVDPLFGSRGETPTTVIQWSKGTIF